MRRGLLLLAAAGLGWAASARAEPQILPPGAPGTEEMLAYTRTEAYRKLLAGAMARVPASEVARCPRLQVADGAIILGGKVAFGPGKQPVGGAWRHSRPVSGCGAEVLVSFFFFAQPDGTVITVVGVPGDSHADLMQQRTARTFVLMGLDAAAPGCRSFTTANTKFEGYGTATPEQADPGATAEFRPWHETWTMLGCGKRFQVPLNFSPNRLGVAISQPGGIVAR